MSAVHAENTLQREIEALGPWFHNLHLPGGVQTLPDSFIGGDFPHFKWLDIAPHIPQDLTGWRVLDVGCNAGFYSFELARRGASVLAIDVEALYLKQARWAAGVLGLERQVEFRHMGVYEVAQLQESFDLVWFMGVFYHLRYPLLALDVLAQKTRRLLMFQTLTLPGEEVYADTHDHPLHEREPCSRRAGPRWRSSSTASPATTATGGWPTMRGWRRCCAPAACACCSAPRTRCTCASPTPRARRASGPGTAWWARPWARCTCSRADRVERAVPDPAPLAICAGRFLLPNAANLGLVRAALARAPHCRVFVRRAHMAASPANPFDSPDRISLLHAALTEDERVRTEFVPLREHWDDRRLLRDMGQGVGRGQAVVWMVAGVPPVAAEDLPEGWSLQPVPGGDGDAQAAAWLEQLYAAEDPARGLAALQDSLPDSSLRFLREWIATPAFATVRDDWRQIAHEKRQWSVAPYPVVLVTVDAIVRAAGHVLLIRRGRSPGRGLWALPGGFLEPREHVVQAALRELVEETGLPLSMRQMQQHLKGVRIFDHPERSQRGRIITHTYFFDLGDMPPPPVQGGDDAAAAQWVPIAELPALENQLHDDHFHMLDTFLHLGEQGG